MSTSRIQEMKDKLEVLYCQLDQLHERSNTMTLRAFSIREEEYEASKNPGTGIKNFTEELAIANKEYADSQIEKKIDELKSAITKLEIKIYGEPLGNSPRVRPTPKLK